MQYDGHSCSLEHKKRGGAIGEGASSVCMRAAWQPASRRSVMVNILGMLILAIEGNWQNKKTRWANHAGFIGPYGRTQRVTIAKRVYVAR